MTAQLQSHTRAFTSNCLDGGGQMGALMRSIDWSTTPIGPVESWSPTLQMMVRLILANRLQMLLWWGPRFIQIYNDAFWPAIGDKHPRSMGQPANECWTEIWHIIGPLIESPFRGGEPTWMEDIFLHMNRKGFMEETHWTIAYSPVMDDTAPGGIGGVIGTVNEITEKIVGERRVRLLRDLGARSSQPKSAEEACTVAADTLTRYREDVPFALIYLAGGDRTKARLAGVAGLATEMAESPLEIDLAAADSRSSPWPLAEAFRSESMQVLTNLSSKLATVPPGPWPDPPRTAVVCPIHSNIAHQLSGLLVLGISSHLTFDSGYSDFCGLVASQVAAAIANARAYEEERKRAEALAEIDRAKTAFFSNVSHEFRTPITLMLGPIEDMLARAEESITIQREELDMVHRNSLRLLKLVNTLLDFSRIEAGRVQAIYEPVDLSALTADLAGVFRSTIEKAGLRLIVDCPPLSEQVYVDRTMWEKIVLNLLSNAFKFTFEGEIKVALRSTGLHAEFTVQDTGTGIPEHELPRLFERFHRIRGAQGRTFEGSGIGLALVQELIRLHGGDVRVESALGRGSRFIVSILFGAAHLPAERVAPEQRLPPTQIVAKAYVEEALRWLPGEAHNEEPGALLSKPRILLADDNADLRQYVRRLLDKTFSVHAVSDGDAALAAAQENPPDLVLTDVMMPRLDGFGLLKALRGDARTTRVPIILLSARAGEEARVEGLAAGADDYLVKPFSARELLACVNRRLEIARGTREALEREHDLRKSAEAAETRTRQELASELSAMTSLHTLSTRLLAKTELQPLLEEVLNATMLLQHADFGMVQLHNRAAQKLEIVSQRGFPEEVMKYFCHADETGAACCEALHRRTRIIIEDVLADASFAPHRAAADAGGFRAIQCTPLFSRHNEVLGIISTYFRRAHRPLERELRLTDLYARQAAELIERKQVEEALQKSEEKYRALFDLMDEGFCTIEVLFDKNDKAVDYRFMEVNGAFEKQSGLKDACGKRVREMIPQLEEHWFEIFGQIALTGEPAHFENHAMQLDRWFDVSAFRVGHPRERNVAILFNDITERKRVEAALRRSEAYLAEGQRLSQTGSWALNVSTGDLFWSLEHFRIFGVDSVTTKLTQELFFRTLHPDDHERVKNHFENVVRERSDFESDYRIARPDGTVRSIRAIAHPVLDQSGQVVEYVGTVIDMTERRRAEEALRESEARFRSYFELGLIGMAITSPIKGILEVNDEICRILGYERGELLQKSWAEMTHPDDLASDIAQFNRVLAGEIDGYTVDKRWIRKDRRVIDSIMAAKCLRRADGSVDYFAGLVLDTTTRKQAEMALRKAQEELAHVTRVTTMGELAASIAHEINQPLGAIVNNSNVALRLLNNAMESDGELREILADIVKDSNRASTIIARVRALATRSTPEKTSLHLRDVVVEALALAQGELAERRIAVRTELADNLPLIYADRVQLQQVLLNLVMNASEAMSSMPDDRRVLTICARRDEADGRPTVRMTVSDLGHGFNVENTERLFDAFYTNKPHGMGMGLRISRSIIEAHGGHLWAATNENAGATLTCVLPAAI